MGRIEESYVKMMIFRASFSVELEMDGGRAGGLAVDNLCSVIVVFLLISIFLQL